MGRTSRYLGIRPFAAAPGEPAPFPGLRPRLPGPATAVLEHVLRDTDRLDLLALHYYDDTGRWWRILDANPELLCAAELSDPERVGDVVLVPPAEEPGGR